MFPVRLSFDNTAQRCYYFEVSHPRKEDKIGGTMDIEYTHFDNKTDLYGYICAQLERVCSETDDVTAVLANTSALLMLQMPDLNWAGFYRVKDGGLVLGPFQGKPAVAHIEAGAGVCGTAVSEGKSQLVEDVHTCCNHISCDFATNSELVVPIFVKGGIFGVIDLDSPVPARFDEADRMGVERAAGIIGRFVERHVA